jgi:phosphate starvation-inducible PhoH-like protein
MIMRYERALTLELEPVDTGRLANLCGQFDGHLKQIEARLAVDLFAKGIFFTIEGETGTHG